MCHVHSVAKFRIMVLPVVSSSFRFPSVPHRKKWVCSFRTPLIICTAFHALEPFFWLAIFIHHNSSIFQTLQYWSILQGAANSPLKFFAVFSVTTGNFNLEFYTFISWNLLHLTAKKNLILLKNDEVIDFLTWPPTDFSAFKNVHAKNAI